VMNCVCGQPTSLILTTLGAIKSGTPRFSPGQPKCSNPNTTDGNPWIWSDPAYEGSATNSLNATDGNPWTGLWTFSGPLRLRNRANPAKGS
jgi:hypothetical protein